MTTIATSAWIRVEAPDAPTAFALEKRLAHLHATAVGRGPNWYVELEDYDHDRFDEIYAAVEHWLRESGIQSTRMHLDVGGVTNVVAYPADG